jgi:hypothetical protein
VGKYQGSLLDADKGKIHKRFKDKLEKVKDRKNPGQDENWAGLCAIMAKIFSAFHSFDRQIISQAKLERYLH